MDLEFEEFVLAATTTELGDEPAAREHGDAMEFRMDLHDAAVREESAGPHSGRTSSSIAALEDYDGELPLIVTNRAEWEGGESGDTDRLDRLAVAATFPAVAAVDVELRSISHGDGEYVIDHAREHDAAVIASYHDFEATPSTSEMVDLLEVATDHADVGKLAVHADDPDDVLALLEATRAVDGPVATMAMGEAGRHSRAVAPLYGSRIGYAPVDSAEATAPGQFDLATLAGLIEQLRPVED